MTTDRSRFGIPEMPMISPQIATLIPYDVARRLGAVAMSATSAEVTVLTTSADDPAALDEIRTVTGRNVDPIEVSREEMDRLLDNLSGRHDTDGLWLQHRHIMALSRLVDSSLNLGQVDAIRSLVDRALEFAPYSAELWLMKARVAIHDRDVVEALTIAGSIAPNDRRVVRWLDTVREEEKAQEAAEEPDPEPVWATAPTDPIPFPRRETTAETALPKSVNLAEESFRAAREITGLRDLQQIIRLTAGSLRAITGADSVSVYFRKRRGWAGHSTSPQLEKSIDRAWPKQNRVASQVLKRGLPIVIDDVSTRPDDVGPLITQTQIRSFAVLPVPAGSGVCGLAYLNFDVAGRAGSVLGPDVSRAVEVVLNCAGTAAGSLVDDSQIGISVDDVTDTYSMPQFKRMLAAEVERARRYRFSVSVLTIRASVGWESTASQQNEVTRQVADTVRKAARASDVIAHGEDDTFALLLPQTTAKGAALVARRVELALRDALWAPGAGNAGRVATGLATFPDSAAEASELLTIAVASLNDSQEAVAVRSPEPVLRQ